jgi:23S rRNA (adenine2503-C2)-methyltransferase
LPYARPSWEKAAAIARTLHQRGVLTKLRQSAGQDVDGGCGQLRARDVQRIQPVKMFISGVTSQVTQVAE